MDLRVVVDETRPSPRILGFLPLSSPFGRDGRRMTARFPRRNDAKTTTTTSTSAELNHFLDWSMNLALVSSDAIESCGDRGVADVDAERR